MNKSKFLKKSLAAVLAVLMVVAMIPLSAAAAAPTISGVNVSTDVSGETILNKGDNTFEGNISLAASEFTLYLLPGNNKADKVSVSYEDLRKSDKPVKGDATFDANKNRWQIDIDSFSTNDFLSEDGNTITMKVTAVDDVTKETNEYTIVLNRKPDPSDTTISSLRVWTKSSEVDIDNATGRVPQGSETGRIPQLGETKINNDYNTIDITVPFDTEAVWIRDFELASGATAQIGQFTNSGLTNPVPTLYNDTVIILGGISSKWANIPAWHLDEKNNNVGPNVLLVPIKVNAGGFSRDYTLRLKRSSGIESFTFENAIDQRVFPDEGVIAVVMPFGYTNDNYADGTTGTKGTLDADDTLTVKPIFNLEYEGTKVPTLTWHGADGTDANATTLESGKTEIKLKATQISLNTYNYNDENSRLQNATSFANWVAKNTPAGTQLFAAQSANDTTSAFTTITGTNCTKRYLTVEYVEDTARSYDVVVVEAKQNYQALIQSVEYGNEEATIDQDAQTIDITLPTGTDLTKLKLSDIKIFASDAATITLPMYSNIEFVENGTAQSWGATPSVWGDPDYWNKKAKPHVPGDHGSTNLIRSELNLYRSKQYTQNELHGNIPDIVVRVTSQDNSTTRDYTLNFSVNQNYEKPKVTSITLKKGDDQFEGVLDESTGIYRVELPYSYQTTESLKDFQLYYGKTVGATVEATGWGKQSGFRLTGGEGFLINGNTPAFQTITSNSKDTSTKGAPITAKILNPFTNQMESESFYILLVRKAPGKVATLNKLDLTSNGTLGKMKLAGVNEENEYTGTIKGTDVTVKLPWSHYEQNGEDNKGGSNNTYDETDILTALRLVAEKTDSNASVWLRTWNGAAYTDWNYAPVLGEKDIEDYFDGSGSKPDAAHPVQVLVLSEMATVDAKLTKAADHKGDKISFNPGADESNPRTITSATISSTTTAPNVKVPTDQFTVYNLYIDQDDAKVQNAPLTSVKLVGPTVNNWNHGTQDLTVTSDVIRGSIPASMVHKPLYLDFNASPRAFVLGGSPSAEVAGKYVSTDVWSGDGTNTLIVKEHNNPAGYPNATIGHFCDWSVYKDTDETKAECSLLPNGKAYITVDEDGTVTLHGFDKNGNAVTPIEDGHLFVTNEDASKSVVEYKFDLTVRQPSNANEITSFAIDGALSVNINNASDTIDVVVPSTLEKTALTTKWTLSDGATLVESYDKKEGKTGTAILNYRTERLFTIKAENGTSVRTYRVNVTEQRGYSDVAEGIWYYDPIMFVTDKGWMCGSGDGTFDPMGAMTREQFAKVVAVQDPTFKLEDWEDVDSAFPDVEGWAVPYVAFCAEKEYILGSNGKFSPKDPITREQAAIIMCKVKGVTPVANSSTTFADNSSISSWAIDYVKAACDAKFFQGVGDNQFAPRRQIMRCEAAQILMNCANK